MLNTVESVTFSFDDMPPPREAQATLVSAAIFAAPAPRKVPEGHCYQCTLEMSAEEKKAGLKRCGGCTRVLSMRDLV